jgi:hypothetical protein
MVYSIFKALQNIPRKEELTTQEYYKLLKKQNEISNVKFLSDILKKYFTDKKIPTALIGVGSVVTGLKKKKENYEGTAGYNDIDIKLIIDNQNQYKEFNKATKELKNLLRINFINVEYNIIRPTDAHHIEDHIHFGYNNGYVIESKNRKKLDLIIKNPAYLPAKEHIEMERKKKNAFVILYHQS